MQTAFKVQGQEFHIALDSSSDSFVVQSSPRPYRVSFRNGNSTAASVWSIVEGATHPLLVTDSHVDDVHLAVDPRLGSLPKIRVVAQEETKHIAGALEIVDFLESERATRTSMVFVVGGGIVQDIGAFAAAMFKRGVPWTFVPTTLLAQGDSCVGGKTALNHKNTKNLLALFSAPRQVLIETAFLNTLPRDDQLSGMGEIFRLLVTGGHCALQTFERDIAPFLSGTDPTCARTLIANALAVKRAIVEFDEFELDLRRSMNYGHSFGHALEALSDYRIPHGVAVTIGVLVENEVAQRREMLSRAECDRLIAAGKQIVPPASRDVLSKVSLDGVLDLLMRDKKTEGKVLKLATLDKIGQMRFIDFELDQHGADQLKASLEAVIEAI